MAEVSILRAFRLPLAFQTRPAPCRFTIHKRRAENSNPRPLSGPALVSTEAQHLAGLLSKIKPSGPEEHRTPCLRIANSALYQTELQALKLTYTNDGDANDKKDTVGLSRLATVDSSILDIHTPAAKDRQYIPTKQNIRQ